MAMTSSFMAQMTRLNFDIPDGAEPEEVMAVLGEYHRAMGQLIVVNEGTLERFAGDGLMIFFNDPIELENPAANAVKMALAMQESFVALRAGWRRSKRWAIWCSRALRNRSRL